MNSVFGVHELWFSYNDEVYRPNTLENFLPYCFSTFNTKNEAEDIAETLNLEKYREMTLAHLLRSNYFSKEQEKEIGDLIFDAGWNEQNIQTSKISLNKLTDNSLRNLMKITDILFYKVIEHKKTEKCYFIKWSDKFWNKGILEFLVNSNRAITESNWMLFEPNKKIAEIAYEFSSPPGPSSVYPFYKEGNPIKGVFILKYPKKIASFNSLEEASFFAIKLVIKLMSKFPSERDFFFSEKNKKFKNIAAIIDFSLLDLERIQIEDLNEININKLKSYMQLLKYPPFEIIRRYKSINGKYIQDNLIGLI